MNRLRSSRWLEPEAAEYFAGKRKEWNCFYAKKALPAGLPVFRGGQGPGGSGGNLFLTGGSADLKGLNAVGLPERPILPQIGRAGTSTLVYGNSPW
jgi:hypothetical protein